MRRWILGVVAGLAAAYVIVMLAFQLVEPHALYHPPARDFADCTLPEGVRPVSIGAERGLLSETGADALAIFYHGNASDACNWRFLGVNHLSTLGHDTLVVEYPGYGGDPRRPSRAALESTVRAVDEWAQRYDRLTIIGYSIGTGPASLHGGLRPGAPVILFAPFDSMYALVRDRALPFPRRWLVNDYDNTAALARPGRAPVTVVYGARDRVIPPARARALASGLADAGVPVTAIERRDLGHGGFFDSPRFDTMMAELLGGAS